jgi:hypothetical protein
MEITNEIKAKVFAQYLGQQFIYSGTNDNSTNELDTERLDLIFKENDFGECKLLLTPLSEISNKDAIELGKMAFPLYEEELQLFYGRKIINEKRISFLRGQFLQSQGYDLPNYLLGDKTLIEAGLAIKQ